jgi:hypothetical protein
LISRIKYQLRAFCDPNAWQSRNDHIYGSGHDEFDRKRNVIKLSYLDFGAVAKMTPKLAWMFPAKAPASRPE